MVHIKRPSGSNSQNAGALSYDVREKDGSQQATSERGEFSGPVVADDKEVSGI
jgi:hypothetical protein